MDELPKSLHGIDYGIVIVSSIIVMDSAQKISVNRLISRDLIFVEVY